MKCIAAMILSFAAISLSAASPLQKTVKAHVASEYGKLFELYKHLHSHPEISFQEAKTGLRMGREMRALGFDVTQNIGGHGVVCVLKNGRGPTVLVRTDTDALPVSEATGLPYASKQKTIDDKGVEVPIMHACGHDVHMTCWVGTAKVLTSLKDKWSGTLVFIAQPAEERGAGARMMLADGLFRKFPVPDYCLALHVSHDQPVGTLGYTSGFAMANVDSVDITVKGVGGHGSQPQSAKDPIVLAAQIILDLQTIVSREIHPLEPAVVTVGSIHGGTKHNIIPDDVHLQLTLRSYSKNVREHIIESIKRICHGQALAAGVPKDRLPEVKLKDEYTPATYNDPVLVKRVNGVFAAWFGEGALIERKPTMGGEDFGRYGTTKHKIPVFMFRLGSASPATIKRAQAAGRPLPSLHSSIYAPDPKPTITTGITAMSAAVLDLLKK